MSVLLFHDLFDNDPMSSSAGEASGAVWRVSAAGRLGSIATVGGWLALAIGVTAGGAPGGAIAVIWLGLVALAAGAWRWAFVPYVALNDSGVAVQNRILRTTVAYGDVASVRAGYYGVTITRRSGDSVTAWAVQKSNLKRWQGKGDTRADEVARAIRNRAGLTA